MIIKLFFFVCFYAKASGDLYIQATCSQISSLSILIEDCYYWNENGVSLTTSNSSDTSYPSGIGYSHTPSGPYEVSFEMTMRTGFRCYFNGAKVVNVGDAANYGTGFSRDSSGRLVISTRTTTTSNQNTSTGITNGSWQSLQMVIDGTSRKIYHNDTQIVSDTLSWLPDYTYYFNWAAWATGTVSLKNIKVKSV